jgi:hypothetical protein
MFDRIRILLGPHEGPIGRHVRASTPVTPERGRSTYRPGIGNRMRQEHAALMAALRAVLDSHWRRDYVSCLAHLRRFDRQLDDYLASDEVLLEAYLAMPVDGEAERMESLRALRTRLRTIARQAHEFAGLRPSELHPPCRLDFGLAFLAMAKSLRECLEGQMACLLPLYKARDESGERPARTSAPAPSSA